jgi:IS1 family transposase
MNRLSPETRASVVAALSEGNSLHATSRMTGVARNTVSKLLTDLGVVCSIYMDRTMRDLPCKRIEADEIWSFVGSKQKNVPDDKHGEWGDIWTWVALDSDSKLVPTYRVGPRDLQEAQLFMADLAKRMAGRIQLTTDGLTTYLTAVSDAFGRDVDYAQLVKIYGNSEPGRYSPAACLGTERHIVSGNPDRDLISTSYVERQNLTMRMSLRRFTRLTNAFSKKVENHTAAVSLHFMHYNFCRVHKSIGTTPAGAIGLTDHPWKIAEVISLLDEAERAVPITRGHYRPRKPRAISK